ncbi:hypothetical protein CDAR_26661 [Caerostris darwini]|uniref:Uncharacterized protein n=1 Tax=Caerostris darwini TaxID=1538125 RepID=A0AAV4U790_9ARAC|nr:hypothetical protein CDAR_26661 [Caerostris darwini]
MNKLSKTPPNHSWYFAKKPGGSFQLRPRFHQTAFSRFLSGHTSALTFRHCQKICHWCSYVMASPAHILICLGFDKDEVLRAPQLFLRQIHGNCLALLDSSEISINNSIF